MKRSVAPLLIVLAVAAGCNRSKVPPLHPVRGTVLRGEQPLYLAKVTLVPAELSDELIINGVTDERGNFQISTTDVKRGKDRLPGAPTGTYKVVVALPMDANQSGGGEFEVPGAFTVQAGENTIPTIDVARKK